MVGTFFHYLEEEGVVVQSTTESGTVPLSNVVEMISTGTFNFLLKQIAQIPLSVESQTVKELDDLKRQLASIEYWISCFIITELKKDNEELAKANDLLRDQHKNELEDLKQQLASIQHNYL